MSQFLGQNTEELISTTKTEGRAKDTFFKSGVRIKRSTKKQSNGLYIHESIDFASSGKEGILADKHTPIPV